VGTLRNIARQVKQRAGRITETVVDFPPAEAYVRSHELLPARRAHHKGLHGHHHITLGVGGAQEDYDFHTRLLGLRCVKKTVLFDGKAPIYHLYYGNETGDPSTLIASFPFRQSGLKTRRGSGQVKSLGLSVPTASLDFWDKRLAKLEYPHQREERFGEPRIHLAHPLWH
jgi:catechol 2,3-dioxygenase-like lactoylglutathione lyase family enzyme